MKPNHNFWRELNNNRPLITKQQYNTIKGQAKAGQIDAARRGMMKIMRRRGN
jgi:hypothetical protein